MKKMLFSAIAMVAFAGSGFANNDVNVKGNSESFVEYKYEISTADGNPLLDVMDEKCYMRVCLTAGGKTTCTSWFEVNCEQAKYSIDVQGDVKNTTTNGTVKMGK